MVVFRSRRGDRVKVPPVRASMAQERDRDDLQAAGTGRLCLGDRLAMGSCGCRWVQFEALFAG